MIDINDIMDVLQGREIVMTIIVINILKKNIGTISNRLEFFMILPLKTLFVNIQPKSAINLKLDKTLMVILEGFIMSSGGLKGISNQIMNAR
jgi:hypothetical protein